MAEAGAVTPPLQTAAATREKAKLRKVLGRIDLVLFTACAILGFDTVAASAQAGAQAVTWLLISLVIFLIPYGMLTAELGSAFPVEGGPYEWARLAFGRCAGSVTAILYWLSNPTWIGGTLTASTIATLDGLVLHKPLGTTAEIIVGLAFVWVTVAIAIVAFRIGKWGPNIGTLVKIAVVALFTILFIAFLVQHGRPAGASSAADLKPSLNGFLTVVGLMVFLWVGFELANGAAEEMHNPQRDVPKMILRSGVICAIIYGAVIIGIVLVIPKTGLSSVSGFVDAYSAVSGVFHIHGLNVVFAILPDRDAAGQRRGLAGGRRPDAGDRLPGRRRAEVDGPVHQLRHPDRGQHRLRGRLVGVRVPGLPGHQRQAGELLRGDAVAHRVHDRGQLLLHLSRRWCGCGSCTRRPAGRTGFPAAWRVPGRPRSSPRPSW